MIRKSTSVLTALFALMLLVAFGRANAQGTSRAMASGGFMFNGSYVATIVNAASSAAGSTGTLSLTTSTDHLWGFVYRVDWVSSTEAHIFAHVYGKTATLEVDISKTGGQNMVAFRETDDKTGHVLGASALNQNGAMLQMPLVGSMMIQKATP